MDLRTTYMGLELSSPIVVSACPLSENLENILHMEDAGAGAVVLFSLFEEQIRREDALMDSVLESTTNIHPEASGYFPDFDDYHVGSEAYLDLIRQAKARVDIPIIGSLNGISNEGWIDYARQMEQAGADGIEMNIFFIPADVGISTKDVESRYLDIVRIVRKTVSIPVAVKLNPYFSTMGTMAADLRDAGADALVLFNRFYQPDIDIERLRLVSDLQYSVANEIRLPLLWIAILHGRVPVSLAATTGVQTADEVVKYLLAGADVAMTASSLYKHGIDYLDQMNKDLALWMERHQFATIDAFKGVMSQKNIADPTAYERANYIKILEGQK
ncbi:MAG: dihydroorotate dehydrogenase-like protein [Saprospiraceae bacterium]|nr:dihydroorotate dehydrogenase-like protein [Saprospiraceae bacterium]